MLLYYFFFKSLVRAPQSISSFSIYDVFSEDLVVMVGSVSIFLVKGFVSDFIVFFFGFPLEGLDDIAFAFASKTNLDKCNIEWSRVPSQSLKNFVEEAIRLASAEQAKRTTRNSRLSSRNRKDHASLLRIHHYLTHESVPNGKIEVTDNSKNIDMLDDETVMRTDVDCQREQKHRWERHTYAAHDPELHKCAWNPVYPVLCTASPGPDDFLWRFSGTNDTVDINRLRNTATPSESILLKNQREKNEGVLSLDWNYQGNTSATGNRLGKVGLWTKTGQSIKRFQTHETPISLLKWSKTGKFLLSGSLNGEYSGLEPVTHSETRFSCRQQRYAIIDGDWLDDWTFATCAAEKIYIFKANRNHPAHGYEAHEDKVNCIRFHPTLKVISTCSDDKTVKVWDTTSSLHKTLGGDEGHNAQVPKLEWLQSEENILATSSFDSTVKLWDMTSKTMFTNFERALKSRIYNRLQSQWPVHRKRLARWNIDYLEFEGWYQATPVSAWRVG